MQMIFYDRGVLSHDIEREEARAYTVDRCLILGKHARSSTLIKFHAAVLLKIVQKSVINSIYPDRIFKLVVASFKLPPLSATVY